MDWVASNFCVIVKIFEFYSLINCPLPLGLNAIFIQPVLRAHKLLEDFPDLYFDPSKTLHRALQNGPLLFGLIKKILSKENFGVNSKTFLAT